MKSIQVTGMGWAGRSWGSGGSTDLLRAAADRPGACAGAAARRLTRPMDPEVLAEVFPGRWNPRRALPDGLEPLVLAFATALEEAGWWVPGMPEPLNGALVLGTDTHYLRSAEGFARELAERGPAGISPSGFLFSLPSSATSILGILFGLRDYQATVTEGGLSGVRALAHALDLLRAGRIDRAAVGAISVVEDPSSPPAGAGLELAVTLCLEPIGPGRPGGSILPLIEESCILEHPPAYAAGGCALAAGIAPVHGGLAAPGLLAVAQALEKALEKALTRPETIVHHEPGRPGFALVRIAPARLEL